MSVPNVTLRDMLKAGVHFGHQTRHWDPSMAPYIYGARNRIHIINLEKTLPMLVDAMNFIGGIAAKKGRILFVGTKPAAQEIVAEEAARCNMPYVSHRWLGGMLTNFDTIRLRINRLKELEEMRDNGDFFRRPKKEQAVLNRELTKLEKSLGGLKNMRGKPDILFVIDQKRELIAVAEAIKLGLTVVGIIDTNCDPDGIDYVIPGNDDSIRSIKLITGALADSILEGKQASSGGQADEESRVQRTPPEGGPDKDLVAVANAARQTEEGQDDEKPEAEGA